MTDTILVTTTFSEKEEALQLARHLLEKRLIACAQLTGSVDSLYWWQDKIEQETEYRLIMKTVLPLWERLEKEITENHSYEVPEIIASRVSAVSNGYHRWLLEELQQ